MHLYALDWIVAGIAVAICFIPALFFGKRSGKSTAEFFASGRSVPWWLAGLSMVATTFSSDTPNLVANFVRTRGRGRQLAVVGLHADRRGHRLLLRPPVAPFRACSPTWNSTSCAIPASAARRGARLPRGVSGPAVQLRHHGHREPGGVQDRRRAVRLRALADAAGGGPAERGLRRPLRPVGRAGHRHDAVLHQDVGGDRGGVFRRQAAAGGRAAAGW